MWNLAMDRIMLVAVAVMSTVHLALRLLLPRLRLLLPVPQRTCTLPTLARIQTLTARQHARRVSGGVAERRTHLDSLDVCGPGTVNSDVTKP